MPHIVIKLYPGRERSVKQGLAEAVADVVAEKAGCGFSAVSVAIEETSPENWAEDVYKPDILGKEETLFVKPGYNPFE